MQLLRKCKGRIYRTFASEPDVADRCRVTFRWPVPPVCPGKWWFRRFHN